MWFIVAAVLAGALALITWISSRHEIAVRDRAVEILRQSGYEGMVPATTMDALERIEGQLEGERDDRFRTTATAAFDQVGSGAIVADETGRIIVRNRAAAPYKSGRHGDALIEEIVQLRLKDALQGETTDEELHLHGPPDQTIAVIGCPLLVDGTLRGAVVLIDNVTEQHRVERIRRDFVANVSHELRTPVGALSLLAETIEGESDPETIRRLTGRMQNEAARLSRLIDDLLDLSRIDAGLGDQPEDIALASIVSEAAAALRSTAELGSITLEVETQAQPLMVYGNHNQLVSAVTNLFENAIKYTEPGGTVVARLVSHGNEAAIAVADSGIGIPQKDLARVFERFYRVDRGRSSTTGGTGLGLSIVRHVAANHRGRVDLVSEEGVGSTFTLVLPLSQSRATAKESA